MMARSFQKRGVGFNNYGIDPNLDDRLTFLILKPFDHYFVFVRPKYLLFNDQPLYI